MRLMRIINVPKRAIGTSTVEHVARIAAEEGAPMLEIARNASDYPALQRVSFKLEQFYALIADLAEFAAEHSLSALVEEVVARTGYLAMLRDSPEDRDKEEIVQEFVSSAKLFEETSESPGLSAFLEDIALVSDTDNYDADAEAVSMMTVHSAKGLEFPYVFLPGFEDGLFPSSRSLDNRESQEEERRLAYVAITRAKKALTILYTKSRVIYGRTEFCTPSRFLDEIPEELVEKETAKPRAVVTNRRPAPDVTRRSSTFGSAPARSTDSIIVGDKVAHPIFGKGVVVAAQDMGGDTLLEVEFFSGQTKKLMQNYAKLKLI